MDGDTIKLVGEYGLALGVLAVLLMVLKAVRDYAQEQLQLRAREQEAFLADRTKDRETFTAALAGMRDEFRTSNERTDEIFRQTTERIVEGIGKIERRIDALDTRVAAATGRTGRTSIMLRDTGNGSGTSTTP